LLLSLRVDRHCPRHQEKQREKGTGETDKQINREKDREKEKGEGKGKKELIPRLQVVRLSRCGNRGATAATLDARCNVLFLDGEAGERCLLLLRSIGNTNTIDHDTVTLPNPFDCT